MFGFFNGNFADFGSLVWVLVLDVKNKKVFFILTSFIVGVSIFITAHRL
jgi:hypothetical protein